MASFPNKGNKPLSAALLRRRLDGSGWAPVAWDRFGGPPPRITRCYPFKAKRKAIVVVDACSTGASLAGDAAARGYEIVHVPSLPQTPELAAATPEEFSGRLPWLAEISADGRDAATVAARLEELLAAHGLGLAAVLPGAAASAELADRLVESVRAWAPRVRGNAPATAERRRSKWAALEAVRAYGLKHPRSPRTPGVRAPRQCCAAAWEPVQAWLAETWPTADIDVVVKPAASAGGDGVTRCRSYDDARRAVDAILGKTNALGATNDEALVQEYLHGAEYVVDGVSRKGRHKVAALWKRDVRDDLVTRGLELVSNADPYADAVTAFAASVLDAIDLANGPSHVCVKVDPATDLVWLLSARARFHGLDGFWRTVVEECAGPDQVGAALEGIRAEGFHLLPPTAPETLRCQGRVRFLLIHAQGSLESIDADVTHEICQLASYRGHELFVEAGQAVVPTVDGFTYGGCVRLAHADLGQLESDDAFVEAVCREPDGGLWKIVALP